MPFFMILLIKIKVQNYTTFIYKQDFHTNFLHNQIKFIFNYVLYLLIY